MYLYINNSRESTVHGLLSKLCLIISQQFPITLPFNPTIDVISSDPSPGKVFLDNCPISKFKSGNFTRVPTMIGYNKDELNIFGLETIGMQQRAYFRAIDIPSTIS